MIRSRLPSHNDLSVAAVAALVTMLVAGCSKGGSGVTGSGSTSGAGAFPIVATLVYPTASGESWTAIKSAERFYIKGLDVTVKGTCARGVDTIRVDEGGAAYAQTATCDETGQFTWTKTYAPTTEEGDKLLTLNGFASDGTAISGSSTTVLVRIDNTAPVPPTVTFPATSPFILGSGSPIATITGSVPTDMVSVTGPAGAVTVTAGTWSSDVTMIADTSASFSFSGADLAGNQSASVTQLITWRPTVNVLASSQLGGTFTHGASSYTVESSGGPADASSTHVASSFVLDTGFNHIIRRLRSP